MFIAGAIPDPPRNGVWLGTVDGYALFDVSSHALVKVLTITHPNTLAENMGGDTGHNILFCPNLDGSDIEGTSPDAPFFEYHPMSDPAGPVQLLDLVKSKSYYINRDDYTAVIGLPQSPPMPTIPTGATASASPTEAPSTAPFKSASSPTRTPIGWAS